MKLRQRLGMLVVLVAVATLIAVSQHLHPGFGAAMTWRRPAWLWTLMLALPVGMTALVSLVDISTTRMLAVVGLRTLCLVALSLGLADPNTTTLRKAQHVVALVDVSDSVPDASLHRAETLLREVRASLEEEDRFSWITFAERAIVRSEAEGEPLTIGRHQPERNEGDGSASNVTLAAHLAESIVDASKLQRVWLLTDGKAAGIGELGERLANRGIRGSTTIFDEPVNTDAAVVSVSLPQTIEVGTRLTAGVKLWSNQSQVATLRFFQDGALSHPSHVRDIILEAGERVESFETKVLSPGPITFRAELSPKGDDGFAANNAVDASAMVEGKPTVLLVDPEPTRLSHLGRALRAQAFDVEIRSTAGIPENPRELEPFAFVIVSDAPRSAVSLDSEAALEAYVRRGGGMLFSGGPAGYAPGGWRGSSMESMLPVMMEASDRTETPSVAMVLVIDRSGSMNGAPMEMAKSAARAALDTLRPDDWIGVVAFDSSPTRYVAIQPARNRARIAADIAQMKPGGGTEIFSALDAAAQDLASVDARRKHVVLLTDGRAPTTGIQELVQSMVAAGVTITTVGLGTDVDGDMLRSIAEAAGGRYHEAPDPALLPAIFTREVERITQAPEVQEWFSVVVQSRAASLRGIDWELAPLLHGRAAARLKPSPAELLLASDTGQPLLARWRVGLGWSLAWTSDLKARWAATWMGWPAYSKWIGQVVQEHMRDKPNPDVEMTLAVDPDGHLSARVDARTRDGGFDHGRVSALRVTNAKAVIVADARFSEHAPGLYEARLQLPSVGAFRVEATHARIAESGEEVPLGKSVGQVSFPYPREYAMREADLAGLALLRRQTAGTENPKAAEDFRAGDSQPVSVPLWPSLVALALGLFLAELLIRRA